MPGIDLSTLTAPELRQLLRLARGRHDGLLIDRVEWEIAQRKALESRVGVDLQRKAAAVIEDGDVTIDEVRAFRRPEPGLPPRRAPARGGGRLPAMLGGLVAGSALTAGAFAGVDSGWRLPATIEIPALPAVTLAERAPPPAPVVRAKVANAPSATSDAVAGILAPEPFPAPPPSPVEVAEAPPPAPVATEAAVEAPPIEVAEVSPPAIVEKKAAVKPKDQKPKGQAAKGEKPGAEKGKTEKPKALAEKKKTPEKAVKPRAKDGGKSELAKKVDPKSRTDVAKKKTADKAKLAAKTEAKSQAAKPKTASAKTKLAANDKPRSKATAKPASKTTTAKAQVKKPAATPAGKAALAAKTPAKPKAAAAPAKTSAKPKVQAAAAPTGDAQDTIGSLLARAEAGGAAPTR